MNIFKNLKLIISVLSLLVLTACTNFTVSQAIKDANDPKVIQAFETEILTIGKAASKDPNYIRIPLDSKEDQEWFTSLAFLLWDNKTTTDAFVKEGLTRFPQYKDSFEYIASKIQTIK